MFKKLSFQSLVLLCALLLLLTEMSSAAEIHDAARTGNLEKVKTILIALPALVDARNDWNLTPLHYAAYSRRRDVVELLVQKGADVNALDKNDQSPLFLASAGGDVAIVELLISRGAKVDAKTKDGATPLFVAAFSGHRDILELLLANKVSLNEKTSQGATPLHAAAQEGHNDIAEHLIKKGADMNMIDQLNRTPLHLAVQNNHIEIVRQLLDQGVNVNAICKVEIMHGTLTLAPDPTGLKTSGSVTKTTIVDGRTPLHLAAAKGYGKIALLLIERKADIGAKDSEGKTPLDLAKTDEMRDILHKAASEK